MWIEIFKTGTHTDSSGVSNSFDEISLDTIAKIYNEKIEEDPSYEAPIVKGHPKTDEPAYGWVEKLARRGRILLAKIKELNPEFINEVKRGAFKKISIALYPDMLLRHVGYLGAATPAVHGLRLTKFSDSQDFVEIENDFIVETDEKGQESGDEGQGISNIEQGIMNDEGKRGMGCSSDYAEEMDALKNAKTELLNKIEELQKVVRLKEFTDFANSLIQGDGGARIATGQLSNVVRLLEMAYMTDQSIVEKGEFTEEKSAVTLVKNFLSDLIPLIEFKEFAIDPDEFCFPAPTVFSDKNVSADRMKLHERALEICRSNPGISYEKAAILASK